MFSNKYQQGKMQYAKKPETKIKELESTDSFLTDKTSFEHFPNNALRQQGKYLHGLYNNIRNSNSIISKRNSGKTTDPNRIQFNNNEYGEYVTKYIHENEKNKNVKNFVTFQKNYIDNDIKDKNKFENYYNINTNYLDNKRPEKNFKNINVQDYQQPNLIKYNNMHRPSQKQEEIFVENINAKSSFYRNNRYSTSNK